MSAQEALQRARNALGEAIQPQAQELAANLVRDAQAFLGQELEAVVRARLQVYLVRAAEFRARAALLAPDSPRRPEYEQAAETAMRAFKVLALAERLVAEERAAALLVAFADRAIQTLARTLVTVSLNVLPALL